MTDNCSSKDILKRLAYLCVLFLMQTWGGYVQAQEQQQPIAEVFCGTELNYADVNFVRLYNTLINLTPGVKVNLGHDWQIAGQVFLPIVNEGYAKRNNMLRLSMANVSKEFRFERVHQYFKLTAGLFGKERYGADLLWMYPATSWLMFNARLGMTNRWALGTDFSSSEAIFDDVNWTLTSTIGANVWLQPWATELRGAVGRYLNKDYGMEGEIIRHFKHCSVSLFAQYHELAPKKYSTPYRYSGGFRIVMMLPPYNKKYKGAIALRPASNFRLTYNSHADGYSMQKYTTDPEENERTYLIRVSWGTGNFDK